MSDRLFRDVVDPVERRTKLLQSAGHALRDLLEDFTDFGKFELSNSLVELSQRPGPMNISAELAIRQLRRRILAMGQPDWARQLNELNHVSRAIRAASEIDSARTQR